jgi:16S rRNA (cytidine1402-2'-O)-methyltransferase
MTKAGTVYLIPTVIAEGTEASVITPQVKEILTHIDYFLVENIRTARRYLSALKIYSSIEPLHFEVLDKDTSWVQIADYFKSVIAGKNVGILSESGCPGVADPGSMAVAHAHKLGIRVVPLSGPSSLLLALMASGLNGQHFAFQGYLPIDTKEAAETIKRYERESKSKNQTQLFIETPYRNQSLFANLLKSLHDSTLLCVAVDLTGSKEFIQTKTVAHWKAKPIEMPKLPAVFLFLSAQ